MSALPDLNEVAPNGGRFAPAGKRALAPAKTAKVGLTLTLVAQPDGRRERSMVALAIDILRQRGFTYLGVDPLGLPCYRSPSGALLIGVGSCRSLAYAAVDGRLQVVAAARTAALLCRIAPSLRDLED